MASWWCPDVLQSRRSFLPAAISMLNEDISEAVQRINMWCCTAADKHVFNDPCVWRRASHCSASLGSARPSSLFSPFVSVMFVKQSILLMRSGLHETVTDSHSVESSCVKLVISWSSWICQLKQLSATQRCCQREASATWKWSCAYLMSIQLLVWSARWKIKCALHAWVH